MKKRQISDGWHDINSYSVYTENGVILRATTAHGTLSAAVYRSTQDGFFKAMPCKYETFRSGFRRGTYVIL